MSRATIFGLGHFGGGTAAARWLAEQGAEVTVTDQADEAALADALAELAVAPIARFHLGGHSESDFANADLIVVNPAVRPDSPWLNIAARSGARLCTELELFMEHCPGQIIGVTGSNGKSTTSAMTAAILAADGRRVFLGGNIGGSLLGRLPEMTADDWVVLEISSFQLWHFSPAARVPHIAVVTGCTPNHLDWHGRFSEYVAAKQRILTGQTAADAAVLNRFDPEAHTWRRLARGRLVDIPPLDRVPPLAIAGEHCRIDAACAAAAAMAAGCGEDAIDSGLRSFGGLPQRLERVAVIEGVAFYNDSAATTPESTIAALNAIDAPVWLMAGGKNKGFDFRPLADAIVRRARGAAFFGTARDELLQRIHEIDPRFCCAVVETMVEALARCRERAKQGEAVVLSPACASTDQFQNFRHRGECFTTLLTPTCR